MKVNQFSAIEVLRIVKAIANKKKTGALAKEMGRTSVHSKIQPCIKLQTCTRAY